MPQTLSKSLQTRLLRSPGFRRMLSDAYAVSGVECLFLDDLGIERIRMPREAVLPLHRLERRVPEIGRERMKYRQQVLAGEGVPEYPWVELARPMRLQEELIGYWVMSGWQNRTLSQEEGRQFWIHWVRQGVDLSWPEWWSTLRQLPGCSTSAREVWNRQMAMWEREVMRILQEETGTLPKSEELPPVVLRACAHIRENFSESLTLKSVAAFCGITPEHLSRLFHHSTGLRFREYLVETRVEWICRQLEQTEVPVGELGYRAGFSTLSRYNRSFRLLTGMTPTQWRKHNVTQNSPAVMRSMARVEPV